jgi:GMP synthase (glutamine-hydrolysing)
MHRWAVLGAHRFALKGAQDGSRHLEGQLVHDHRVREWLGRFLPAWLGIAEVSAARAA